MATTRRRGRTASGRSAEAVDDFLGTDNIVPGEVLLTLAPAAADAMTASVPLHPAGPVFGMATELGVSDLDAVLAIAGSAPALGAEPWRPEAQVKPVAGRPRIAVAGGHMRRNLVFRSSSLESTTTMDRHILQTLGIGTIIALSPATPPMIFTMWSPLRNGETGFSVGKAKAT